ncbi:MAG: bestrophin family ion channel [Sandaracinaceae bacterium]
MIVSTNRGFVFTRIVFLWQWRSSLLFLGAGAAVAAAYEVYDQTYLDLPTLPLAVVGAALGIFVSFRTNSAYDRWWEGRKLWGRMINESRHWASQIASYVQDEGLRRRLVRRHVAYVHALRCLLRQQDPFADEEVTAMLQDDEAALREESNLTHALLARQLDDLVEMNADGALNDFRLQSLDTTLRELINIQGGCERIKKTPMPPLYGLLATRLVQFYAVLFPLSVVEELGWWTVPVNLLVCIGFFLIAEAGRVLEDPFTMFFNGLPLSAISRMIDVNARQRIGETDLPPMITPGDNGVLM